MNNKPHLTFQLASYAFGYKPDEEYAHYIALAFSFDQILGSDFVLACKFTPWFPNPYRGKVRYIKQRLNWISIATTKTQLIHILHLQ